MPAFSLEDRIHDLCEQALMADDDAVQPILEELRLLLHEHAVEMRQIAVIILAKLQKDAA